MAFIVVKSTILSPRRQYTLTVNVGIDPNWMHTEGFNFNLRMLPSCIL